ncbi:MAG TPA: right-handed parallel beta-helix repeat-containing protein [Nitrospira sp.]|nr:right-handed parallel beta-helix repeat-containing protein [Nitrospira sp.]
MNKSEISRRVFINGTGSLAISLPLASVSAKAEMTHTPVHMEKRRASRLAELPSRNLPVRKRGATVITVELPNDGTSDCSKAINDAINALPENGGTVWLPYQKTGGSKDCIYRINTTANIYTSPKRPNHGQPYGIKLRSNMLLQLEPGVQLRAMPTNAARAYVIFAIDVHDIEVANGAIIGDRHEHTNSGKGTDEWGHGMQLLGVSRATVRSIYISDCEGDGICVGRGPSSRTNDLIICDVISTRNRRQALSITNGDNISVFDSEFSYTHGTAPQDGIDIEPDGTGQVNNVTIDNCILRGNEASGIEVNASHGSSIRNLTVTNCMMRDNVYSGFFTVEKGTAVLDNGVLYGNAFYQNRYIALQLAGKTTNFTIGGSSSSDSRNNLFANNMISASRQVIYPLSASHPKKGYIAGPDMAFRAPALAPDANNVVAWNCFSSPYIPPTEPKAHPQAGIVSPAQGQNDPHRTR